MSLKSVLLLIVMMPSNRILPNNASIILKHRLQRNFFLCVFSEVLRALRVTHTYTDQRIDCNKLSWNVHKTSHFENGKTLENQ